MSSLGARIAYLRNKKEMSQEEFSKILKIAKSTLGMYETDKREPSHEISVRIAKHFDVTLDWLLTGNEKENDDPPSQSKVDLIIKRLEVELGVTLKDDPIILESLENTIRMYAQMKKKTNNS